MVESSPEIIEFEFPVSGCQLLFDDDRIKRCSNGPNNYVYKNKDGSYVAIGRLTIISLHTIFLNIKCRIELHIG